MLTTEYQDDSLQGIKAYLTGWMRFFGIFTESEERTLQAIDAHIRRRLRAILLRQWNRRRTIVRRLIELGVSGKTAWNGIYHEQRSWWVLSHTHAVDQGRHNAIFAERGLFSVAEQWKRWRQRHVNAPRNRTCRGGSWMLVTGAGLRVAPRRQRPEEPDVRPTSPVL